MMRYIVIDPRAKTETVMHLLSFNDALREAGLTPGKVDHGTIRRGLSIVVDEFGLFASPEQQRYFSIDQRLYAGGALLYGYDDKGHTCDIELNYCRHWFCRWYASIDEIEQAIKRGELVRPQIGDKDTVLWRWPGPRPDMTPLIERIAGHEGTTVIDDVVIRTRKTGSPTDG